ncbi:MAG: hypothetical protein JKY67_15800 [Pseudomonadales bacterium]|nr:hypothetical protein [Pseudomonadales bacterium]
MSRAINEKVKLTVEETNQVAGGFNFASIRTSLVPVSSLRVASLKPVSSLRRVSSFRALKPVASQF